MDVRASFVSRNPHGSFSAAGPGLVVPCRDAMCTIVAVNARYASSAFIHQATFMPLEIKLPLQIWSESRSAGILDAPRSVSYGTRISRFSIGSLHFVP